MKENKESESKENFITITDSRTVEEITALLDKYETANEEEKKLIDNQLEQLNDIELKKEQLNRENELERIKLKKEESQKLQEQIKQRRDNKESEPLDHDLLWHEKYKTTKIPANSAIIVTRVKEFLSQIETTRGRDNRIVIVAELFDYLAEEGYLMCYSIGFKHAIEDKIIQFYESDPDVFEYFKPSTKEFIYAVSGMKC